MLNKLLLRKLYDHYFQPFANSIVYLLSFIKKKSILRIACTAALIIPFQSIFTHGTVTSPPSRVWICFQEGPESPDSPACQDAVIGWGTQALYDWNEVARMDANGMHTSIIMDGNLASAGRPDKYGGLDQVRDDWVATSVTPGPFSVTWTNTAPHETLYYRVYITKSDWTPDQPLTWDSLELLTETGPRVSSETDVVDLVLPVRTGKHVLYNIWQRSLSEEAFYATCDIDFGASTDPVAPVALFTSDSGRCGGPDVTFSAADSYDANGDDLTYFWDFGDGNTAEGIEVSHSYTGLESVEVTLTVSDGQFSSGTMETISLVEDEDCASVVCPFDTPRKTALPSLVGSYRDIYVIGENGPDLGEHKFDINWNLLNDGLYQFSIQTTGAVSVWINLLDKLDQTFNQENPDITLSDTGIDGFDGSYYVSVEDENFIMVSKTGDFTIYFSSAPTTPACEGVLSINEFESIGVGLQNYPNPFTGTTTIQYYLAAPSPVTIKVYTIDGRLVTSIEKPAQQAGKHQVVMDLGHMENGIYMYTLQTETVVKTKRMILQK